MNGCWKGKMKSFNGLYSNEELKCQVDNDLLLRVTYDTVQMSTETDEVVEHTGIHIIFAHLWSFELDGMYSEMISVQTVDSI